MQLKHFILLLNNKFHCKVFLNTFIFTFSYEMKISLKKKKMKNLLKKISPQLGIDPRFVTRQATVLTIILLRNNEVFDNSNLIFLRYSSKSDNNKKIKE